MNFLIVCHQLDVIIFLKMKAFVSEIGLENCHKEIYFNGILINKRQFCLAISSKFCKFISC